MYLAPKYARTGLILLAMFAAAAPPVLWPQTNTVQPAPSNHLVFDAASIKLHNSGPNSGANLARSGGHVQLTAGLPTLMILAYSLHSLSQAMDTIVGMPNWGTAETFDIEAEAPGNPAVEQKRLMLQSLLADRFKMVVHHETRQLPIYALVLVKEGNLGPQLRAHPANIACNASPSASVSSTSGGSPATIALQDLEQFPCGRVVGGFLLPGDHVQAWSGGRNVSMDVLAGGIGGMEYIDHPVVNRTGLGGDFDFTVEWDSRTATEDFPAPLERGPVSSEPVGNSLLEAMRDQLGFKLDLQKGPVDVIVIDHVDKPKQD
jgi:uncharacterized protein (TIGR03435 family)